MVICIIHLPLGLSVLGDFQIKLQRYIFFPNTQQFSDNFTKIFRGVVKLLIINEIQNVIQVKTGGLRAFGAKVCEKWMLMQ